MAFENQPTHNYLHEILFIAFAQKRVIINTALFIFIGVVGYALLAPSRYRAETTMLVKGKQLARNLEAFTQADPRILPISREDLNSEVQLLTSFHVLKSTAQALNEPLPLPQASSDDQLQQTIGKLARAVTVKIVPASNILNISLQWSAAADAQHILETLRDKYLEYRTSVYQPKRLRSFYDDTVTDYQQAIDKKQLQVAIIIDSMKSTSAMPEIESNLSLRKEVEAQLGSHEQSSLMLGTRLTFLTGQIAQAQGNQRAYSPQLEMDIHKKHKLDNLSNGSVTKAAWGQKFMPQPRHHELRSIDDKRYTLQLFMGKNLDGVKRYLTQNNLNKHPLLRIYPTQRSGEDRLVVIYGNFENRQTALMALKNARFLNQTWAKPYALVHRDLDRLLPQVDKTTPESATHAKQQVIDNISPAQEKSRPLTFKRKLHLFTNLENVAIRQLADSVQESMKLFNLTSRDFLPESAKYKLSKAQLDKQYATLLQEVISLKNHRLSELTAVDQIIAHLTKKIDRLSRRNLELARLQVNLDRVKRDLALLEQSFSNYYKLREEVTMVDRSHAASLNTQIITLTPPWANARATFPNKTLLIPFGLLIAILVGLTVGFIKEYFDDNFKRSDDSLRLIGIPTILCLSDLEDIEGITSSRFKQAFFKGHKPKPLAFIDNTDRQDP